MNHKEVASKQLLELRTRLVENRYRYVNQNGLAKSLDGVLEKLVNYENRKLNALMKLPRFEGALESLRRNVGFSTRMDEVDHLNSHFWQFGYLRMSNMDNPFLKILRDLMKKWGVNDGEVEYLTIAYYLIFGILIDCDRLMELSHGLPAVLQRFTIPDVLGRVSNLLQHSGFQEDLRSSREELGIRPPTSPETVAYNHAHFFYLARDYAQYQAQSDPLSQGISRLMKEYKYLNPRNHLDYSLLFGYIARSEDELTISRVKDSFGNGLASVKTGERILNEDGFVNSKVYVELPPFAGSAYLRDLLAYIGSEVRLVGDYVDAGKIRDDYYMVEYSFELECMIKAEKPGLAEAELIDLVLDGMFEQYGTKEFRWDETTLAKQRASCAWLRQQFAKGRRLP